MTSISYDDIFSQFLGNINDYQLSSLIASDSYVLMVEELHKALSKPYLRRLFSQSELDDEIQTFSFDMEYAVDSSSDIDFVINVLSNAMVVEWLNPMVNKTSLLHQHITSSKESNFYSQASHLKELKSLRDDTRIEIRKMIRDRGYIWNSYLGDK